MTLRCCITVRRRFLRRWQALFFAPLLGIDRLSDFRCP